MRVFWSLWYPPPGGARALYSKNSHTKRFASLVVKKCDGPKKLICEKEGYHSRATIIGEEFSGGPSAALSSTAASTFRSTRQRCRAKISE